MSIEWDEAKFKRDAADAEKKRRAGTHVYHPHFGIITKEQARAMVDGGRPDKDGNTLSLDSFYGDPESGVVKWNSATVSKPAQPARIGASDEAEGEAA